MILERARCVEFCHISSGWFEHIEPHRTPSKHMILERARCVEFLHCRLGVRGEGEGVEREGMDSELCAYNYVCTCFAIELKRMMYIAARVVTDRQTHTQSKHCNPRCACTPRVIHGMCSPLQVIHCAHNIHTHTHTHLT